MADIQRCIDEIRDFLTADTLVSRERIAQAASTYATACQEANRRLGQCIHSLNHGQRSEAIHLAQNEPPLLALLAQLDFEGSEQWFKVAASYGLPVPPRLNLKFAEELNHAYAQDRPIEELMKKHRLLALARAPMRERLPVLRAIAVHDSLNAALNDDIHLYERARYKEMAHEFQQASGGKDEHTIVELQKEIEAADWREPMPAELSVKLEERAARAHRGQLARRFAAWETALSEASAQMDLNQARKLRRQIFECMKEEDIDRHNALVAPLIPSLNWLDNQDKAKEHRQRFENAQRDVWDLLNDNRPMSAVRKAFRHLDELDGEIAADLSSAYLRREKRFHRRRLIASLTAIALVLLLGGGMAFYLVHSSTQREYNQGVSDARTKLDELVGAGSDADANAYIDELVRTQPKIALAVNVAQFKRRIDECERNRETKTKLFEDAFARAEALVRGDPLEVAAMEELKRWAVSDEEKARALRYSTERRALRKHDDSLTQKSTEELLTLKLKTLETEFAELAIGRPTYDRRKLEAAQNALAAQNTRIAQLGDQTADYPILKNALENLGAKAAALKLNLMQLNKESTALDNITAALRAGEIDFNKVRARMKDAAVAFPDGPRRQALEAVQVESKVWEKVREWDGFLSKPAQDLLFVRDSPAAEGRAQELSDWSASALPILGKTKSPVPLTLVVEYSIALQATARQAKTLQEIREIFGRIGIRKAFVIYCTDNRKYYVIEDPDTKVIAAKMSISPIPFFRVQALGFEDPKAIKLKEYVDHRLSAQSEIAEQVLTEDWKDIDKIGLDGLVARICHDRIRPRKDLDPLLAVMLMRDVMEAASKGDTALASELAKSIQLIDESAKTGVDRTIPWANPDRADGREARKAAQKFLATMPNLQKVPEAVQKRRESLAGELKSSRHQPIGWLYNDIETGWTVAIARPIPLKRELKIIHFQDNELAGWASIGEIDKGKPVLRVDDRSAFAEGRFVFVQND